MSQSLTKSSIKKNIALSSCSQRLDDPPINWLIDYDISHPEVISLAAGLVDYPSLPVAEMQAVTQSVLQDGKVMQYLQYGTTQGSESLRVATCKHFTDMELTETGYRAKPEHCVITTGSQQLLELMARSLLDPGDIVLLEGPTYFVFMGVLQALGAEPVTVPIDENGIIPEALETVLDDLKKSGKIDRVKFLYTVDYFQNPSAISLSEERKPRILDLVQQYSEHQRILIVEDAAYRPLSFDPGAKTVSVKSYDPENQWVAYTGTFSKSFSPGLKVGYGFLPEDLLETVVQHKGNTDFGTANFNQAVMTEALISGVYDSHRLTLVNTYREKSERMHEALLEGLPESIQWSQPKGGLYFWLTVPEGMDTGRTGALFQACLKENVLYVPGSYCYWPDPQKPDRGNREIRLAYGTVPTAEIQEGIERFARAFRSLM